MDIEEFKRDALELGGRTYSVIAEARNKMIADGSAPHLADAFALETAQNILAFVVSSVVSFGRGQVINESTKVIYEECRIACDEAVEKIMLENGMNVLRVDVPVNKEDEHGVG